MNERAFDHLRFRGPGIDLTVGLIPGATWCTALEETVDGRRHVVNMPTEEVFTSPDRRRTKASSARRSRWRSPATSSATSSSASKAAARSR